MQHKRSRLPAALRSRWSITTGSLVLCAASVAGIAGASGGGVAHAATANPDAVAAASFAGGGSFCLDAQYNYTSPGTLVGLYSCKNATDPNQLNQTVKPMLDHTVHIGPSCLEGPTTDSGGLHLATCQPSDANQRWYARVLPGTSNPRQAQLIDEASQGCVIPANAYPLQLGACGTGLDLIKQAFTVSDAWPSAPLVRPSTAGSGAIASFLPSGICLDAWEGKIAAGTTVGTYGCGGSAANQQWVPESDGTLRMGPFCLQSGSDSVTTLAACRPNAPDSSQTWVAQGAPGGVVQIVGGATNGCLTATPTSTRQISVSPCRDQQTENSPAAQQQMWWVPSAMPVMTPAASGDSPLSKPAVSQLVPKKHWTIVSALPGLTGATSFTRSLDVQPRPATGLYVAHDFIVMRDASRNAPSQKWTATPNADGSGSIVIRNEATKKCLDYWSDDGYLYPGGCNGGRAQLWKLVWMGGAGDDRAFMLVHVADGLCAGVAGTDSGSKLVLSECKKLQLQGLLIDTAATAFTEARRNSDLDASFPAVKAFAGAAALAGCQADATSCSFDVTHQTLAVRDQTATCISHIYQVPPGHTGFVTLNLQQSTGWENTVGAELSIETEFGIDFIADGKVHITVTGTYSHTWSGSVGIENSANINADPGEYVWFTNNVIHQTLLGTWTFAKGTTGEWSMQSGVTIPVSEDSNGQDSFIQAHATPVPPRGTGCPTL
jgi:Ricin-type beta-trefoil lectin domain/Ricin-type beta-trefoil lectin domain-like